MNSADRLARILEKIQSLPPSITNSIDIYREVFQVKGCIAVANKLMLCQAQIGSLEDKLDKTLASKLRLLFSCNCLNNHLPRGEIPNVLMVLNSIKNFMDKENINKEYLKELSEYIVQMQEILDRSKADEVSKRVIQSYIDEMSEAIVDIDIGGIDSFITHSEVATGKIILYHESFKKLNLWDKVKDIYDLSTKLINEAQSWIGFLSGVSHLLK